VLVVEAERERHRNERRGERHSEQSEPHYEHWVPQRKRGRAILKGLVGLLHATTSVTRLAFGGRNCQREKEIKENKKKEKRKEKEEEEIRSISVNV
jgi:hypothetical protein